VKTVIMKVLSPVRTCDPWAVYSAKSFEKHSGGPGTLTPIQANILSILKKTGGMAPPLLLAQLGGEVTPEQLEREFAALRHMEKVRAEKRGQHLVWRPW